MTLRSRYPSGYHVCSYSGLIIGLCSSKQTHHYHHKIIQRLGISIEPIKLGNPQQNGRHERMHLTLKQATTKPPAKTLLQQQDKFKDFIHEYNYQRPHQALEMKKPAQLYQPSTRKYEGLPDVSYPFDEKTGTVTNLAGSFWAIKRSILVRCSLVMTRACGKSKTMCG